jgi:hypothetical protein
MSRAREMVAAGVIRAGRRHDAIPDGVRRPVEGVNLLDTPLGVAEGASPARLRAMAAPEPDLSARYRVPSEPDVTVNQARVAYDLARAIEDLELGREAHRLLVWADSWSPQNVAGLLSLIEAARAAGGGLR